MAKVIVNLTAKVNAQQIRREIHAGRNLIIVPSRTLPENVVMNGGLYPAEEIDKHYPSLEGTLAPLGHPQINGEFISAISPEGINIAHVGAFNRNVKKAGNRIYLEKWIDIDVAQRTENGRRLLERIEALEKGEDVPPIHTSVAAFIDRIEASEEEKRNGYEWIAKIYSFDHDAILLDEVGAATPEQGVGMMVNCDLAKPIAANEGALIGESYREKENRLDRAVKQTFATGKDDYAYVIDFTDSQMIVVKNGDTPKVFGYKEESGKVVIDTNGKEVQRRETWFEVVANGFSKVSKFLNPPVMKLALNSKDEAMPITEEEKLQLSKEISKTVVANVGEAIAKAVGEAVKPLSEAVTELQGNQQKISDQLAANAEKECGKMREAVKAKFGEVIANSLQGEALAEAYRQCGQSAPVGEGAISGNSQSFSVPSADDYFGKK